MVAARLRLKQACNDRSNALRQELGGQLRQEQLSNQRIIEASVRKIQMTSLIESFNA